MKLPRRPTDPSPYPATPAPRSASRSRRAAAAAALVTGTALSVVVVATPAGAAVPAFPDNIVVFPDRDMVSLEGFAAASGQDVRIEVRRGGTVIGSTTGVGASAEAIAAGEPTVEVNHPGGVCWGAGGGLQVTPDIRGGDVVTVGFGGSAFDTTVQDVAVTGSALAGTTLTVDGRVAAGVNSAQLEQRIINPAMKDNPEIARRDVRAVPPADLVAAPKGNYLSGLSVSGGAFTATYEFPDAATAAQAAEGQLRIMAWQNEDADANRQGLTISEFGEINGPGMGGCPAGAQGSLPPSPTAVTATQNGSDIDVTWTPAVPIPGAAPVLGYTVRAVSTASTDGVQREFGARLSDPQATSVSLPGTLAGHRIEVRAFGDTGESWPPALDGSPNGGGDVDTAAPPVTAAPPGGSFTGPVEVTLSSAEAGAQIYYTLDGTSPLDAPDTAGAGASLFVAPFTIEPPATGSTVLLRFVAIDAAGNTSLVQNATFAFGTEAAPSAPTLGALAPGDGQAVVNWTAPADPGSSAITGYALRATPVGGSPATAGPVSASPGPNATQATLTGLVNGVTYDVTIAATNAAGTGPASATAQVTPTAPATDTVTVTRATWKIGDFRIEGTGTQGGATLTVRSGGPTGAVIGTATVAAPVAPEVTGAWRLRIRTGPFATTRPTDVYVISSRGGQVGPVAIRNG